MQEVKREGGRKVKKYLRVGVENRKRRDFYVSTCNTFEIRFVRNRLFVFIQIMYNKLLFKNLAEGK